MGIIGLTNIKEELQNKGNFHENLSVPQLVEKVVSRKEGILSSTGAVTTETGKYTGRSPKDRFVVRDSVSNDKVDWGAVNQPIDEASFEKLYKKVINHLKEQDE